MRLNLGAGYDKIPGFLNVDIAPLEGVDVVWDLDQPKWPWDDGAADRVRAYDIFEHVENPLLFMRECHRILRPGGIADIRTCYWKSENAFTDPTHKRFPTFRTFEYWVKGTEFNIKYGPAYTGGFAEFEYAQAPHLVGSEMAVLLKKPL